MWNSLAKRPSPTWTAKMGRIGELDMGKLRRNEYQSSRGVMVVAEMSSIGPWDKWIALN